MIRNIQNKEEQKFWITISSSTYEIRFYSFNGLMYADVMYDDEYLVAGRILIANQWILPTYMNIYGGNFRIEAYKPDSSDYVEYGGFNGRFRFAYYTKAEIEAGEVNTLE